MIKFFINWLMFLILCRYSVLPVYSYDHITPMDTGIEAYKNKNYAEAFKILKVQAERREIEAQYYLGLMYIAGRGVAKDEALGLNWLEQAAFYDHKESIYNLGVLYYKGIGGERNFSKALEYFIRSSYFGNPKAIYNIGLMYQMGQGVKQDSQLAAYYFIAAAEIGDKHAQNNLGLLYSKGAGVPKSLINSYKWLTLSSQNGFALARENLTEVTDWMSLDQIEMAQKSAQAWRPKQYIHVTESGIEAEANYPTAKDLEGLNLLFSSTPSFFLKGSGTGFLVNNDGYILTNAHVVEDCDLVKVIDNHENIAVKKIKVDGKHDLALLKATHKLTKKSALFDLNKSIQPGDVVFSIGFPLMQHLSNEPIFTVGNINAKNGYQGDMDYFQFSAPIQPGNSGGPLLNQKGNVIGISTASLTGAQNVNFAIKNSVIQQFLKSLDVKFRLGIASSELTNKDIFKQSTRFISPVFCLGKYYD